ncbi:NUDIX hydrolase [Tersicoccus sp. Bi-70]|nr:NUDIX hydrolase [Tersicoccus sp. Bi-70]
MEQARPVVRVSAVVLADAERGVLTVRKRGTSRFMFPGGKPEPGETSEETAVREVAEELGVAITADRLVCLGTFRAAAANEADHDVEAVVFTHPVIPVGEPTGEIEELRWQPIGLDAYPADVAPLLSEHVLPGLS